MVKVISLSNEAYEKLKRIKNGKSFSEIVVELVDRKNKKNIKDFFGIWRNEKRIEEIKKMLKEDREKAKLNEVRF